MIECSLSKIKLCRKKRDEKEFFASSNSYLDSFVAFHFRFYRQKASFFAMPYYFGFALCCMEDGKRLAKSIQDTLAYLALFIGFSFLSNCFPTHRNITLVLWNTKNQRGGSSYFSTANFAFINRYLLCQGISSNGLYGIFQSIFGYSFTRRAILYAFLCYSFGTEVLRAVKRICYRA